MNAARSSLEVKCDVFNEHTEKLPGGSMSRAMRFTRSCHSLRPISHSTACGPSATGTLGAKALSISLLSLLLEMVVCASLPRPAVKSIEVQPYLFARTLSALAVHQKAGEVLQEVLPSCIDWAATRGVRA